MTHSDSDKKATLVSWKWPLDLTTYDRSPALSEAERASLESLIKCFDAHHPFWPEHAREYLDRFLRPINDVLDYLAIHNVHRRRLITNTLLREMHDRRQSFWGWTREEWVEFLRADTGLLRGKYYRPCLLRPPLMACGYLHGVHGGVGCG